MKNVAIIAGGDSGEYTISMKSAAMVCQHMDQKKFHPYLLLITKKKWVCIHDNKEYPIDRNDFSVKIGREKILFDVVFNAIHGTPGEDGKLQGYFDLMGIPYTSCDLTTSALTFNKSYCKKVVSSLGIRTPDSVHLFQRTHDPVNRIKSALSLPFFVKPNCGGSSVGMSKVSSLEDIEKALKKAFKEDSEILVEEFIRGRELTCGVLRQKDEMVVLPVTEIISKNEFFDFDAKYHKGKAEEVVPANIPEKVDIELKSISSFLYEKLNCKGVVRFDFIWDGKHFHFLEVNTVPGLSGASIVPKMAAAHGWSAKELYTILLTSALKGM